MTDAVMSLRALVEKISDADLLRETIGFAAERLMELGAGALTGAAYGEKSAERLAREDAANHDPARSRIRVIVLLLVLLRKFPTRQGSGFGPHAFIASS